MSRDYWLLTDTHLGHDMMVEKGYRPKGFSELIVKNVDEIVKPGDVVINLGDICFYREEYWHQELMAAGKGCEWWLARGNHDKKSNGWYLDHGWSVVFNQMILEIYGYRVAFSHKPILAHSDFDINIHGHLHNNRHRDIEGITDKHLLFYMEHDYRPVSLRKMLETKKRS